MSRHHGKAGDYRRRMVEDPLMPMVCAYKHKVAEWGPCSGPVRSWDDLQSDHYIPLADAPWQKAEDAWVVPACPNHNRKAADEAAARRAARTGGRMTETTPRPPKVSGSGKAGKKTGATAAPSKKKDGGWSPGWLAAGIVAALIAAASWLNAWPLVMETVGPWIPLAVTLAVLCAGPWAAWKVRGWRRVREAAKRAEALQRFREGCALHLPGTVPGSIEVTPLRGAWHARGVLVRARVGYPMAVKDTEPALRAQFEKWLREKIGDPLGITLRIVWDIPGNWVEFEPGEPLPAAPTPDAIEAPDPYRGRADGKLRTAMEAVGKKSKGDWSAVLVRHDAIGPLETAIHWPPEFNAASDDAQADLLRTLTMSLPGRWRPVTWDGETRTLTAVRRPEMPAKVANHALFDPADTDLQKLALGLDEDHHPAFFNAKRTPHMLVAGETGSGKTVLLRTIVTRACGKRWEVRIADPKRTEFVGFRGWPGVSMVATQIEAIIALITITHADMDARNEQIEDSRAPGYTGPKITPKDFNRILLVIDEAREFIDRANALWKATGGRGMEHPVVELFRSIARLGRSAGIHLVTGIQRPDAKVFGGEARDNYGARGSLGSLSQEGARMMHGNASVGRDVPDDIKGRATVDLGKGPQEIQVAWTPDPGDRDGDNTAEDWAILAELREIAERAWEGVDLSGVADAVDEWVEEWERQQNGEDDGSGTSRGRGRQRGPQQPRGGPTVATPPPDRTRPQPAPERPARPEMVQLQFLRFSAEAGEYLWVIDDGEAVQVMFVDDDPTDEDNCLVTFRDAKGVTREVSLAANTVFELADPQ